MKETSSTATGTDEASTPLPTKTGDCGVGGVAGAAQEQATQAAAERDATEGRGQLVLARGGGCVRACK